MNSLRRFVPICLAVFLFDTAMTLRAAETPTATANVVSLNSGWQIQSSCEVKAAGEQISAAGFAAAGLA